MPSRTIDREVREPKDSELAEAVKGLELESGSYVHDFTAAGGNLAGRTREELELALFEVSSLRASETKIDRLEVTDGKFVNCDFAGINWNRVRIERVTFTGCRFTGAQLRDVSALDARFVDCQMRLASLTVSSLVRCAFESCDLGETNFHETTIKRSTFRGSDLTMADFSDAKLATTLFTGGCGLGSISGLEALRGAELEWPDLAELAPLLAAQAGIKLVR